MPYKSYHAHVYYDGDTRLWAGELREALAERFKVNLGRWREGPVGPHPMSMYQVAFGADQFQEIAQFLMERHGELSVLIHPNTGDDVGDHGQRGLWLGRQLPLDLDALRQDGVA
jgi:DOPA 4,5-dioxygenase